MWDDCLYSPRPSKKLFILNTFVAFCSGLDASITAFKVASSILYFTFANTLFVGIINLQPYRVFHYNTAIKFNLIKHILVYPIYNKAL